MKVLSLHTRALHVTMPRLRLPVGQWLAIYRERARLSQLSEHALRDIGLDREAAAREAARPVWDLPAGRR